MPILVLAATFLIQHPAYGLGVSSGVRPKALELCAHVGDLEETPSSQRGWQMMAQIVGPSHPHGLLGWSSRFLVST